jgi:hypothetical protein
MIYCLSTPSFVKTIKLIIRCYLLEKDASHVPEIQKRALNYASDWRNWHVFQKGPGEGKDAEYFALVLICLAVKDKLLVQPAVKRQQENDYLRAGLFLLYCDTVDRLVLLRKISIQQAVACKMDVRNRLCYLSD